jgi:hypothetical protein
VIARLAAVLAALALAVPARGQGTTGESGRFGSFELGVGGYKPNIDSEFTGTGPYQQVFGSGRGAMFRLGFAKALWIQKGAIELGFKTGFFRASGHGLLEDGTVSQDRTAFNVVPTSLTLTYRADFLPEDLNFPLVPYARVAFERYNWWVTKGSGAWSKSGATNGYSATLGLAFSLNFLDRGLARELDSDSGINQTYLFFDATKSKVDDFGSKKSWDLSDPSVSIAGGLMLVF